METPPVGFFDEAGNGKRVEVHSLLDSKCGDLVHEIVALGAMVSLSLTSDGGALGVTVTMDSKWRREYFRNEEELLAWLQMAFEAVETAAGQTSASPGGRRRQRGPRAT